MAPIEPKPRGLAAQFVSRLIESLFPFVATWLIERHNRTPTSDELVRWFAENEQLLAPRDAGAQVDLLVGADLERSASLEAKAVAILQGVAIVSAILVGIELVTWPYLAPAQVGFFLVSDFYAFACFMQAIHASRPKVNYLYTQLDVEQLSARSAAGMGGVSFGVASAARRLAYVRANEGLRRALANNVEASLESLRNSAFVALLVALPYTLDRLDGVLVWAVHQALSL